MKYKPDYLACKQRMLAFWEHEIIDRPLISVVAPKIKGANISPFKNTIIGQSQEEIKKLWVDPTAFLDHNITRIKNTHLGGDTLPVLFLNFGPSGHVAYYGAQPKYQPETIWYSPIFPDGDLQIDKLHYDESIVDSQIAFAEKIHQESNGEVFLSMPDNCGTLDALATLMGTQELMIALLEDPEIVKEGVRILNDGHRQATNKFYHALRKQADDGCMHGWMHLWAPGILEQMQCDISVMLSPKMYEEFVLPELSEQMNWIDYPVYHFDGIEQIKHLDMLLSLEKLRAIQWTHVAGQPSPVHYLSELKRIQKSGKGIIVMTPPENVKELVENLDPRGLYIHTEVKTPEQADEIVNIAATCFRRK